MSNTNLSKWMGTAAIVVGGVMLPLGVAMATTNTTTNNGCTVKAVGSDNTAGAANSRFTVSGNTVSAKFTVTGNDCNKAVTISSWEAPNADKGQPYSAQTLFDHTTKTGLVAGTYTISTTLPDCFYQVDLINGSNATGPNGSAVYAAGSLLGSLHGGTKACGGHGGGTPTPTPTPSHTPTPTPTPSHTPTPTPTPSVLGVTTLPDTGAGTDMAPIAVSGIGSALTFLGLRRRQSSR